MHHFLPNILIFLLVIQALLANCCLEHERDALLEFKAGVGDISNRLASWRGNNCCDWAWIGCSNQTGHVVKLNLRNTNFEESVDGSYEDFLSYWNYHSLTGEVSPSLAFLSNLKHLDLNCNNFGGNKFPKFISSLKNLMYLNLSNTNMSGMIPSQLGNLSRLFYLDLSGSILYTDTWWFSNLRSLRYMEMSGVNFKDSNDWVESLNKLPSIEVVILDNNNLTQISNSLTFVNFTSLRVLHLSYQNFNSTIPNWLGNLKSLTDLLLENCNLVSPYPATLGNLTSLSKLTLDFNSLDGMIPPMRNLTRLTYLSLYRNNIEGDIRELLEKFTLGKLQYLDISFTNLSGLLSEAQLTSFLELKTLKLSGNNITVFLISNWNPTFQLNRIGMFSCNLGPKFPAWLERQKEVQYLYLDDTGIDDNIPSWFWKLSSLRFLSLSNNRLRGNLPASLVHMTKLIGITLDNNRLEGEIPFLPISLIGLSLSNNSFSGQLRKTYESSYKKKSVRSNNLTDVVVELFPCGLTNLMVLDLSSNNLSIHLPPCWSNISQDLILANNKFFGATPSSFSCSKQLTVVSFNNNNLTGDFPIDLKFCIGLQFLDLGENKYLGGIPDWVGENLHQLTYLRLRSNLLSGNIPSTLTRLEYLQFLDLGNNHLSGPLPSHLDNFTDMSQSFRDYFAFDSGESLQAMTKGLDQVYDYKNLDSWKSIDLSNNNLTGEIPKNIVVLDGLLNLNLSHNHLTGEIPFEIGNMTSLESLDICMNNLSGAIPQSMSVLFSLGVLNLSCNNLSGSIPTGRQLQTLDDPSIYSGNPNLCGPPLEKDCERSGNLP